MRFELSPVAFVRGGRVAAEDDAWAPVRARIELAEGVPGEALAGLDAFSHAEVVFVFDRVADAEILPGARRPRGRADWPLVGIFAQRGRNRPNRLGVSICRILSVRERTIEAEGLDAIDATPVLDIKPVLSGFLPRGAVKEPAWAQEIMQDYW
jgi:tRNA (Thr-GGU) A37 N-methylase